MNGSGINTENFSFSDMFSRLLSSPDSGFSNWSSFSEELEILSKSETLIQTTQLANSIFIEEKLGYLFQVTKNIKGVKEKFLLKYYKIHSDIEEMTKKISCSAEARQNELKANLQEIAKEKLAAWDNQLEICKKAITWLQNFRKPFISNSDRDTLEEICQEFSKNISFVDSGDIKFEMPDLTVFKVLQNLGRFSYVSGMTDNTLKTNLNVLSPKFIIGSLGDKSGEFCRPWGVCTDPTGRILVSDRSNHRIQIFDESGKFILKFGKEGTRPGEFSRPAGIAVDEKCRIIVADKDNHRIQVFTYSGGFLFTFGCQGFRAGQFVYPWDVAVNSECDIAVSDSKNHRVQLFNHRGEYLRKLEYDSSRAGLRQLDCPRGLAFCSNGNLLVTDFNNHRVLVVNKNFTKIWTFGQEGRGRCEFFRPQGIACDENGRIAVADSKNYRIQIFNKFRNLILEFGTQGDNPGQFDCPQGICFHPNGNLIVVDLNNNRVQVF